MKTGIRAAVIVATVFAGTYIVEAQHQRTPQQKGQRSGNRIRSCPNCGWSPERQQQRQLNPQHQQRRGTAQIQGPRPQQRRQFRNQTPQQSGRGAPQFQARQGPGRPQWSPEQRQQAIQQRRQFLHQNQQQLNPQNRSFQARQDQNQIRSNPQQQQIQQRRQQIMKRFDADKDGHLSEKERKQMKKAWKQRQKDENAETRTPRGPKPAE